jgi:hypothetical protein
MWTNEKANYCFPANNHGAKAMDIGKQFKDIRKAAYLNSEGADRPLKSPVADTLIAAARRYRLARLAGDTDSLCAPVTHLAIEENYGPPLPH